MIPASLYHTIFLYGVIVLTLFQTSSVKRQSYIRVRQGNNSVVFTTLLTLILAVWIGQRPILGRVFGDTANYAYDYYYMQEGGYVSTGEMEGDRLWNEFMYWCSQCMDVSSFFTIVSLGYFGLTLLACKRFFPNNTLIALLFNLAAFSFYSYGTNGIRNGLACAIVLNVLSLALGKKKEKLLALLLAFCAVSIHKSTSLPVLMCVLSMYAVKSFKWAYTFWLLSIVVSLVAGGAMESLFMGIGFDDRLDSYISDADDYAAQGYKSGFRWDFLLYSMMPIVLGYYIVIKRSIQDKTYLLLLNTYTLSNAFWIMIIRASYSNRFAYLSWFMYPMVLAYPLFKLNVWGDKQGKRLSQIMLTHVGFTWVMSLL